MLLQAECLAEHQPLAEQKQDEAYFKLQTPRSAVNAEELIQWIQDCKESGKTLEADLKDAKRRVSAAKGPIPMLFQPDH